MNKKILLILIILTFPSPSHSFDLNLSNPQNVARLATEWGLMFKYEEVRKISCDEIHQSIDQAAKQAEQAVLLYKNHGIDFYDETEYDFSKLDYIIKEKSTHSIFILVSGKYKICIRGNCEYRIFNKIAHLKKMNSIYLFCGMK